MLQYQTLKLILVPPIHHLSSEKHGNKAGTQNPSSPTKRNKVVLPPIGKTDFVFVKKEMSDVAYQTHSTQKAIKMWMKGTYSVFYRTVSFLLIFAFTNYTNYGDQTVFLRRRQ